MAEKCRWREIRLDPTTRAWSTTCGFPWPFPAVETSEDPDLRLCPYCGRSIVAVPYVERAEEEE